MKTIYVEYFCDDEIGECDMFFSIDKGKLSIISGWNCNDAQYRDEYMDDLFEKCGIKILPLPDEFSKKALRLARKFFGA